MGACAALRRRVCATLCTQGDHWPVAAGSIITFIHDHFSPLCTLHAPCSPCGLCYLCVPRLLMGTWRASWKQRPLNRTWSVHCVCLHLQIARMQSILCPASPLQVPHLPRQDHHGDQEYHQRGGASEGARLRRPSPWCPPASSCLTKGVCSLPGHHSCRRVRVREATVRRRQLSPSTGPRGT